MAEVRHYKTNEKRPELKCDQSWLYDGVIKAKWSYHQMLDDLSAQIRTGLDDQDIEHARRILNRMDANCLNKITNLFTDHALDKIKEKAKKDFKSYFLGAVEEAELTTLSIAASLLFELGLLFAWEQFESYRAYNRNPYAEDTNDYLALLTYTYLTVGAVQPNLVTAYC